MLDAGSVFATLGGKFNPTGFAQFDGAMKKSIANAAKAEEATNKSTTAMGKMGTVAKTGAAAGVLALVAATAVSVKQAANFEQAMADVQAVTKANSRDMKLMSNAALDLGAKTGVGATKAAGALAELAKGGLSTKQTIGALEGTIAMSQAGSMDLAEAANTVAQALNLFALKGEDASHVADAFATAANKTTADVGFFAQGLAQGGAAAKSAGLSFDETTAALEIMAANGFKSGSDAGTSLKTTLIQLANPSKKAQEVTKQLGLEFFKSNGEMKSLSGISGMLQDKFDGLSRKQRLSAAATLVGTDGMRALLALYDQGPAKIRQFEAGLRAQGTAQDVATAKTDNLKGSWDKMVAQLQTLSIKVGTAMLPTLKSAADGVTRFFDSLNRGDLRATGFGRFVDDVRGMAVPILGVFSTIARGAALALGAASKAPGFGGLKILAKEAEIAADGIDGLRDAMNGIGKGAKPKDVKITARLADQVTPTLIKIAGTKLGDKVQRILGDDAPVQKKIAALRALGINGPTARFLAQTGSVEGAIASIAGRSVTIPVNFKAQPFSAKPPGSASGRPAGAAGVSLVGEGGGPEAVGNMRDGFRMTTGPEIVGLGPDDWVIPTEQRYRGRAMELMASALGIPAFKKGKKPKRKPRPIPKSVYLGHSVEYFDSEVQHLEQVAQDRDKKNKLTGRARKARKELESLKRVQKRAHSYDDRVKKHEDEANIQRDNMSAADSRDDVGGYKAAWKNRKSSLERARVLLRQALKFAPPSSKYHQDIRARIAQINTYLDDMTGDKAGSPLEAKDVDATTFTAAEQGELEGLDSKIALAALTTPTDDDLAAQRAKEQFLAPLLAAVQSSGGAGRGGASAITDIAGELKSTRDAIADLNKAPDVTADQQATAEQSYQRGLAAGQTSFIDRLTAATIQGAQPSLVIQSYVPPSPSEARRLADYAVGGIDYQGGRPASTQRIGV